MSLFPRHMLPGPQWLVIGVNSSCNLRCRMCDIGTGHTETAFARSLGAHQSSEMTLELAQAILSQVASESPTTRVAFVYTEPLIWPHLGEAIRTAKTLGLTTSVTTNGLLLERWAPELADAGLDELMISLDGPAEIHNQIRGRERAFERALAGMDALFGEPRRPAISAFCVVTPWNAAHLNALLDALAGRPLDRLGFMHTNFIPPAVAEAHNSRWGSRFPTSASNVSNMDPSDVNLVDLRREIHAILERPHPFSITFSPDLTEVAALERYYGRPEEQWGQRCNQVPRTLMVRPDGSVVPAHGRCFPIVLGHLPRQSLAEIWNGEALRDLRTALTRNGGLLTACSRCCGAY